MPKKKPAHYVSNKDLLIAMEKFRENCKEAAESGEDKPKVSNSTRKGRIANRRVEFKVVE